MRNSELKALIKLLDDDQIYEDVRNRLIEHGQNAIPYLQGVIRDEDPERKPRARLILRKIHYSVFESQWIRMLQRFRGRDLDLEEAVWFIARIGYPAVDVDYYSSRLDQLAAEVDSRIRLTDRPRTKVRRLAGVLANQKGFAGDTDDYYDPQNSFLNRVIDRRLGIPISLSVLYLLVGKRLKIPLKGVGIPAHFMVKYVGPQHTFDEEIYIDPYHRGRFLGRLAVERFCLRAGLGFSENYLTPLSNAEIIERMLRHLVFVYTREEDQEQLHRLKTILDLYAEHYSEVEE